jgi:large subunit ribosomal protein L9
MAKELEVVFIEDRKGQFKKGQKKSVKLGYARNFLFPLKLAVPLTREHEIQIVRVKKEADVKLEASRKGAEDVHSKVNGIELKFIEKSHDGDRLYGSVTPADIASELNKNYETELEKYDLKMITAIKEVGEYPVYIDIHPEVKTKLTVVVEAEVDLEAIKAAQIRQERREADIVAAEKEEARYAEHKAAKEKEREEGLKRK